MIFSDREIKVHIRPAENPGSVRAYADLRITLSDGELQLIGFAIVEHPGKEPFVGFPQNRGRNRYFPVVTAKGDLREEIIKKILRAYEKQNETERE